MSSTLRRRPDRARPRTRRLVFVALAIVSLGLVLGFPAAALAAAPIVSTDDVLNTGATTVTVDGSVNPEGQSTTYAVQWDVGSSDWCQTDTGSAANSTTPQSVGATDNTSHAESVGLSGLVAGTDYCAQLIATNADGEGDGGQIFWTQAVAPVTTTFDAFSTGATTATVEGEIDPGGETTTYTVQWDVASSSWCQSGVGSPANQESDHPLSPTDNEPHSVALDVPNLTPNQDYCAQLIATDAYGESDGGLVTWTQGIPSVFTVDAFETGLTTAEVDGDVNPANQATTYEAQYARGDSAWCQTGTVTGLFSHTTAVAVTPTDTSLHSVSVDLTGLTPGVAYCAQVVATNASGEGDGGQLSWTQPPAPQHGLTVTRTGAGSGTVTSSPAGINCGAVCSSSFDEGSQVTLTATPAAGSTFAGWSGGGCSGAGTCQVTLTADTSVTATFAIVKFVPTLTVSRAGSGAGTVTSSPAGINCGATCSQAFALGTQVTLTATPASGSAFTGWSGGGCSGAGICTVTLNADTMVTATFSSSSLSPPPPKCVVPKVKGKKLAAAKTAIKKAHCAVGKITKVASSPKNRGKVVSQSPKPGKHLPRGSKVALKVGK